MLKMYLFKLMGTGDTGGNGQAAPRHVEQGQGSGQGTVTTLPRILVAETVGEPTKNQEMKGCKYDRLDASMTPDAHIGKDI